MPGISPTSYTHTLFAVSYGDQAGLELNRYLPLPPSAAVKGVSPQNTPPNLLCLVCFCAFGVSLLFSWSGAMFPSKENAAAQLLEKADEDTVVCGGWSYRPVCSSGGPAHSALGQSLVHVHTQGRLLADFLSPSTLSVLMI